MLVNCQLLENSFTQILIRTRSKLISFVIPTCNEEKNIPVIIKEIAAVMSELPYDYRFLFVDDGSSDHTLPVLQKLSKENKHVHYLSLSRNFGHQNALKAGLDHAEGDAVIMMDAWICNIRQP